MIQLADCQQNKTTLQVFRRNKLEVAVRGDVGLGEKAFSFLFFFFFLRGILSEDLPVYALEGHCKDGVASAGGEVDPQTNAFTGEGIKPWALRVRVGLNCAALLKIQQKHHLSECSRCLRLDLVYV